MQAKTEVDWSKYIITVIVALWFFGTRVLVAPPPKPREQVASRSGVICKLLPPYIGNIGLSVNTRIGGGSLFHYSHGAPTVYILWAGPIFRLGRIFQNTLQSVRSSSTIENSLNSKVFRPPSFCSPPPSLASGPSCVNSHFVFLLFLNGPV